MVVERPEPDLARPPAAQPEPDWLTSRICIAHAQPVYGGLIVKALQCHACVKRRMEEPAMPGMILVILDRPEAAPTLLGHASRLADLLGSAVVHALIIRMPPHATILSSEEVLTRQQEDRVRAREQTRAIALTDAFREGMRKVIHAAHLTDVEGDVSRIVAARGSAADFLVIGQSVPRHYDAGWQIIQTALFKTDRPVLVVPQTAGNGFGRRVALAWRDDNRTIRAVLSAMRCFAQIEHLFVLAGQKEGRPLPHMPDILVEHSVPAELRILPSWATIIWRDTT